MKIGAMNNPKGDLVEEIHWIAEHGFDFIDLTLEPPNTLPAQLDANHIKRILDKHKLIVIGHTIWSLPIASTFSGLREASFKEMQKSLAFFKNIGVTLVNVHPGHAVESIPQEEVIGHNIAFLKKLVKEAKRYHIKMMLENVKHPFSEIDILERILHEVKGLRLHWDVGHANLGNMGEVKTGIAFDKFLKKIVHVHFSDNNGLEDEHLPLGVGNIHWSQIIHTLKQYNYDKTITLEVHSHDRNYLLLSKEKVRVIWEELDKKSD